jgi:addiction module HigA family antidote
MLMKEKKRSPSHPGRILKNLYLKPLSLSNKELASTLGVSSKTISSIISERKSITPDIALRLSQAFPNSTAESWLNLQKNYDLWQAAHNTQEWKAVRPISIVQKETSQNVSL